MLKINIETIPHNCQRYDTVGDWTFEPDGTININVSRITDMIGHVSEDSEFLVAIHELIEAYLCKKAGITPEEVDEWDKDFEELCLSGNIPITNSPEPGDDPRAPYHVQHLVAQSIEMMLCSFLKKEWTHHCRDVEAVE